MFPSAAPRFPSPETAEWRKRKRLMPHSFQQTHGKSFLSFREITSPRPHGPWIGGPLPFAARQLGLLNVRQHLVEDSLGSLRIRRLSQIGSEGLNDVANFGE